MVSIDTDKLIRDKADNLAAALLKHIGWAGQGTARPDLVEIELLDAVIELLQRERHNRVTDRGIENSLTKSGIVRAATDGKTIDFPLREMDHSDVAGLPTVGRELKKKAAHALMYGAGPMKAATPADVHRIVDAIRMNRGRK